MVTRRVVGRHSLRRHSAGDLLNRRVAEAAEGIAREELRSREEYPRRVNNALGVGFPLVHIEFVSLTL